ncbi:RHS repeat-associated core domain-containing protein, partial [Streptomyces sp. SID3343]|uniref:RHS repeat-associated core domain-containing protein n=1 Tax=Streptomyces sp. SID3343 TaxID=2690260 RepID=UPI0013C1C1B4
MSTGEAHYYYLTDAQGSVIAMTDKNGNKVNAYAYDPYGNARTTTEAVPNPLRYTSTYLDPTGLYKMGARYYDPTVGRFTQRDPAGKEANPYAYAAGDPINRA